ncbi:hypothetical protein [Streptomyces sp. NPDC048606]|uniref:hypothetical protein n=1 Tax=Streptomyces sp. NPDC048606 TaxID=3154726 RepID=UPI003432FC13
MADVARIRQSFGEIIASDHRVGGQVSVEAAAAHFAGRALALQQSGSASQAVRAALYATAAAFQSSAMWAAIDGQRYEAAERYLRDAQAIAAMSGDQAIVFRIWSHAGAMYRHMGRPGEADAANAVARRLGITRDPMIASLGQARQGAILAAGGDVKQAARTFDRARSTLARARRDDDPGRPPWLLAFYDAAEIDSLECSAYSTARDWARAEAAGHRCLARLRPSMQRSRAITTARVARAQLEQGEVDQALVTVRRIPGEVVFGHPRIAGMTQAFGTRLRALSSDRAHLDRWRGHLDTASPRESVR